VEDVADAGDHGHDAVTDSAESVPDLFFKVSMVRARFDDPFRAGRVRVYLRKIQRRPF
jgi:hypothetical protein